MRRALLGIAFVFAVFAVWSPAAGEHFLPDNCALDPISTTYEGPVNRSPYLKASELASFNMIGRTISSATSMIFHRSIPVS